MAVIHPKGLRVNYPIIFFSGIILVITSIMVFLLVLKAVYGNFELNDILPTEENIHAFYSGKEIKTAILYSKYTENILPEGSTWLIDNINAWERYINSRNISYDIINDNDVSLTILKGYDILILPGSKALSDRQIIEIKKYLENGGSLFATSGTATFSIDGKWQGWEFFTEVYGMDFIKEINSEENYKVHTLRGNLSITTKIPAGYNLKIATWDKPIYAKILEPRTKQASFWYDFRTERGLVNEKIKNSAGISYGEYNKGRFVWFGFELTSVIGSQEDYILFEKLLNNCINWLVKMPTAELRTWPVPFNAALILTPVLSNDLSNINNFTPQLNNYHFPVTFFIEDTNVSSKKFRFADINGDYQVGLILENIVHQFNRDDNERIEREFTDLIAVKKNKLEELSGKRVEGVFYRGGIPGKIYFNSLAKNGIKFVISDSALNRMVPKIINTGTNSIMQMGKTTRNDKEVINDYGLENVDFQKYTYIEDIDRVLFEGGLDIFEFTTENQLKNGYSGVIPDLVKYAKQRNIWVTSAPELYNWISNMHGIDIKTNLRSERRILLEVVNKESLSKSDFILTLYFNRNVENVEVSSEIITTDSPEFEFKPSENILVLFFKSLEANETRSYFIDYNNIKA